MVTIAVTHCSSLWKVVTINQGDAKQTRLRDIDQDSAESILIAMEILSLEASGPEERRGILIDSGDAKISPASPGLGRNSAGTW